MPWWPRSAAAACWRVSPSRRRRSTPGMRVFAAEPAGADDAARSKAAGVLMPQTAPRTIADGLLTSLGDLTWPVLRDQVERVVTVTEEEIVRAMRLAWERAKLLIEPSAAVAVAAVLSADVSGARRSASASASFSAVVMSTSTPYPGRIGSANRCLSPFIRKLIPRSTDSIPSCTCWKTEAADEPRCGRRSASIAIAGRRGMRGRPWSCCIKRPTFSTTAGRRAAASQSCFLFPTASARVVSPGTAASISCRKTIQRRRTPSTVSLAGIPGAWRRWEPTTSAPGSPASSVARKTRRRASPCGRRITKFASPFVSRALSASGGGSTQSGSRGIAIRSRLSPVFPHAVHGDGIGGRLLAGGAGALLLEVGGIATQGRTAAGRCRLRSQSTAPLRRSQRRYGADRSARRVERDAGASDPSRFAPDESATTLR